jgi:serine phosphatase RsbU (regulator of sigma subunit)
MGKGRAKVFDFVFTYSSEALVVVNGSGEVVEGNEAAKSALGPSLVGKMVDAVFEGTRFPADYRDNAPVIRSIAASVRSPDGERRTFKITPLPIDKGGVIVIGKDISSAEVAHEEIERLRKRVRNLELERNRANKGVKAGPRIDGHALRELEATNQKLEEYNERIVRELDLAAVLQRSLIPQQLSPNGRVRYASRYEPMGKVGGDYYDVVDLQKGRKGVIVADVSGHGVSSAFISAMLKMFFINFSRGFSAPSELLRKLNKEYCEIVRTGEYVTAFYAVFDPRKGQVSYSGAGHPPAFLHHTRGEGIERLHSDGFFIGMYRDADYADRVAGFEAGDRCLLYTDGIVEAYSERRKEQYGGDRLFRSFRLHAGEPIETMVSSIIAGLKRFMGKSRFLDDLAIVAVECADESEHDQKSA